MLPDLSLIAAPLAALSVVMVTSGLALGRRPNRIARSLAGYDMHLLMTGEAQPSQRATMHGLMSQLRQVWLAVASTAALLIPNRGVRLQPWLVRQIIRAGISITVRELVLLALSSGLGGLGLGFLLWGTPTMAVAMACTGVGGLGGYVRYMQRRRLRAFGEQLPDVLSVLILSLHTGYSIRQALDATSRQVRPPAAQEFAAVIHEMRIGVSPEQALLHLAERVKNEDLQLLINAITIHRETGGNLINMVETIESTARERVRLRGEVRSLTAQAALGGWIISLLPVVLGVLLYLLNPGGISFFWTGWLGAAMGGVAVFNVVLGNIVLRRIAKIEL